MSELTELNKYNPTPAEKKLIEVLTNPENYSKNVSELCNLAEVSRNIYYDAFKKPEFVKYYNALMVDLVKSKVGAVIAATAKFAQLPKNHQDRKILLEMGGIYTPKEKLEHSTENGEPLNVIFNVSRPPKEEKENI